MPHVLSSFQVAENKGLMYEKFFKCSIAGCAQIKRLVNQTHQ